MLCIYLITQATNHLTIELTTRN